MVKKTMKSQTKTGYLFSQSSIMESWESLIMESRQSHIYEIPYHAPNTQSLSPHKVRGELCEIVKHVCEHLRNCAQMYPNHTKNVQSKSCKHMRKNVHKRTTNTDFILFCMYFYAKSCYFYAQFIWNLCAL